MSSAVPPPGRSPVAWAAAMGGLLLVAASAGYLVSRRSAAPVGDTPPGAAATSAGGTPALNAAGGMPVTPAATADLALAAPDFGAEPATQMGEFHPAVPATEPRVGGMCDRASVLAPRADAYHCTVDNTPFDPCYAVAGDATLVVCGAKPTRETEAFLLRLIQPPPENRAAAPPESPWVLVLDDTLCERRSGIALVTVGGKDLRYECRDGTYLVEVDRGADTWAAQRVTLRITTGPEADRVEWVPVREAWR